MLQQVSEKLLGQFVDSLEAKLRRRAVTRSRCGTDAVAQWASPQRPAPEPAPIDLLELAGGGALKKYGPPVFGAFLLAAVVFTLGRLRIARKALRGNR